MGLAELRCWQSFIPFCRLQGRICVLYFSRGCPYSLALSLLPSSKAAIAPFQRLLPLSYLLLLWLLPFTYKDPWDYTGPTQIIQNNLPVSRPITFIISAAPFFPCNVTYALVTGVRVWVPQTCTEVVRPGHTCRPPTAITRAPKCSITHVPKRYEGRL